jgi:DNA-binding GntR family transcriptional regulator
MKNFRKKSILVDDIRNYIRDLIVNFHIKPGEQLNELELIKKMGVSRSPLREAFRLLEAEGFVVRHWGRGVFVREVTANDVHELFPIRAVLEGLAAELAASRLTEKELKNLGRITEKMEEVAKAGDTRAYARLNFDFHKEIVKGARNKRLEEMIKNQGQQSMWFFFATLYFKKSLNFAMTGHREIYLALKKKDGKLASECIKNHINDGAMEILEYFL